MDHTNSNQNNSALLFIPDISGYSNFVNETEVSHALHIVQELLDGIIESNDIGLEVSEIEGDAIFFYRNGKAPTVAELLAQVQKMFVNFHAQLKRYDTHRICECGACCSANKLTLKFVAHYGPVAEGEINKRKSLFGKDVIIAHRLMKNKIDSNEYSLFTNSLIKACSTWVELPTVAWSKVESGIEEYEAGMVKYCHLSLAPLYEHVPEPTFEDYSLKGKLMELINAEIIIEAPLDLTFDVVSDLGFRHNWLNHIKGSDQLNSKITQNGSTHRCVIKDNESDPFMVAHSFEKKNNTITFWETNHKDGGESLFKLTETKNGHTRFQYTYYAKKNFIVKWMFKLFLRKKFDKINVQNNHTLNEYCKKLVLEGKRHPNSIVLKNAVAIAA